MTVTESTAALCFGGDIECATLQSQRCLSSVVTLQDQSTYKLESNPTLAPTSSQNQPATQKEQAE
jgi:hypothetical protein